MKNSTKLLFTFLLTILLQFISFSQEGKVKIYKNKSGSGACLVVFPNSPEPLVVLASKESCTTGGITHMDDWTEIPAKTVVTVTIESPSELRESPSKSSAMLAKREKGSGMATGKRQHKPIMLYNDLRLGNFGGDLDRDGIEVYTLSWKVEEGEKIMGSNTGTERATNTDSSSGCCTNGVCKITISVDKKHTKSGHVTLMK
jgi:hypothetical protein